MKSFLYKRIIAFLVDFVPLCIVFNLVLNFIMTQIGISMLELVNSGIYYLVLFLLGSLWMFKDVFNGASVGKRIVKIRVVGENNQKPTTYKLILRNLTLVIWPLEVYFLLNKKIRFGDKITNTKVVEE